MHSVPPSSLRAEPARASTPDDLAELQHAMTGLARGLFGEIAPAQIAEHVLAVTPDADWAVRRAALQALARRYRFAVRDELVVSQRPRGRALLGRYGTTNRVKPDKGSA